MKQMLRVATGALIVAFLTSGCSKEDEREYFTAKEAEACMLPSDMQVVGREVKKVIALEDAEKSGDSKAVDEALKGFSEAVDAIHELYAKSLEDEGPKANRRSAAIAWVMVDFTINHVRGTCSHWVFRAADAGLIEACQLMADPPEQLAPYLLSPGDPRRKDIKSDQGE